MVKVIVALILLMLLPTVWAQKGGVLSLHRYLSAVRQHHPFFAREALAGVLEREQQRRYGGGEEWVMTASLFYQYTERSQINPFMPQEQRQLALNIGAERLFWGSGSHLSIEYGYNYIDQRYTPPIGVFDPHAHLARVTYRLPLMKNSAGI